MKYITTPIYYVNDDPHIGHIYTTLSADALARFSRLTGNSTHLLTGTDEHALKVVDAAKMRGIDTADWAKSKAAVFADAFKQYGIMPDDFIRTTETRHIQQVQKRMKELLVSGDIYLGEYEGWYDKGQEEYISDMRAHANNYLSSINNKPLIRRQEPCFYFKLSTYADEIQRLIESDTLKIRPAARKQEILARLRDGIHDIPCSRPRVENWGVAMPGHEDQTVYVWIDALLNYLTAVDTDEKRTCWPPKIQLVGKDILWFHAVIWPAMLLALQKTTGNEWLTLPEIIRAHGFWIRDGEKMSKSMGNFISLPVLNSYSEIYGRDAIRFFLLMAGPNELSDADFSESRLHDSYTALLANTLGNCCSRVITMISKYCDAKVPAHKIESGFPIAQVTEAVQIACTSASESGFPALITEALKIVRLTDSFIHKSQPFQLAKDPTKYLQVSAILYDSLEALRLASVLLYPIMPAHMETFWHAFSYENNVSTSEKIFNWGQLSTGSSVHALKPLFPRVELEPSIVSRQ
jgi:methionyl-tRNA synthetase